MDTRGQHSLITDRVCSGQTKVISKKPLAAFSMWERHLEKVRPQIISRNNRQEALKIFINIISCCSSLFPGKSADLIPLELDGDIKAGFTQNICSLEKRMACQCPASSQAWTGAGDTVRGEHLWFP